MCSTALPPPPPTPTTLITAPCGTPSSSLKCIVMTISRLFPCFRPLPLPDQNAVAPCSEVAAEKALHPLNPVHGPAAIAARTTVILFILLCMQEQAHGGGVNRITHHVGETADALRHAQAH